METFDIQKACEAQTKYCEEKNYPHFAPKSGRCYDCGQNIYKQISHEGWSSGYSVELASATHITGCPHCNYSYCE